MTSLRSFTPYPSGGTPPIHIPFFFEAAILSRIRSPTTSRSNCAKDNRTFRVKPPHRGRRVELLRHRDEGGTLGIEDLDDFGKIGERAGQPVDLVDDHRVDPPCRDVGEQLLQSGPVHRRAGDPTIIITRAHADPAFVPLAVDEGLAGFALRLQRIEFLLEPLLGRFASVDRTTDGSAPPHCGSWFFHCLALASTTRARLPRSKNRGPDQ